MFKQIQNYHNLQFFVMKKISKKIILNICALSTKVYSFTRLHKKIIIIIIIIVIMVTLR